MNIQYAMQSTISVRQPGSSSQSLDYFYWYSVKNTIIVDSDITTSTYELTNTIVIDQLYSIRKHGVDVHVCGTASYIHAGMIIMTEYLI